MITIKCDYCGKVEETTREEMNSFIGYVGRRKRFFVFEIGSDEYHACGTHCQSMIVAPVDDKQKRRKTEAYRRIDAVRSQATLKISDRGKGE